MQINCHQVKPRESSVRNDVELWECCNNNYGAEMAIVAFAANWRLVSDFGR